MPEQFDAAYWESRYRDHAAHGSRAPNPHLVTEAARHSAGTALDAGCGEGGNAIWLARTGWQVSAVDVSPTALRRARAHADREGPDVAGRIDWLAADLTVWEPPRGHFDLVTAHYVHPPGAVRALLPRLAAAVAPDGMLFVVDHDHADEHAHGTSSVDEVTAVLEPDGWEVVVAESRVRSETDTDGREVTLRDVVMAARRAAS